jgi:hypothetical protein
MKHANVSAECEKIPQGLLSCLGGNIGNHNPGISGGRLRNKPIRKRTEGMGELLMLSQL